jgi:hypothetical protein
MGYVAGKTLRWAEVKETMERTSLLTISLALSLTVLGVTELLHLNCVLAAFVAGIVFNAAATLRSARKTFRKRYRASSTCLSSCCLAWRCRGKGGSTSAGAVCCLWLRCSCCDGCLRCWRCVLCWGRYARDTTYSSWAG